MYNKTIYVLTGPLAITVSVFVPMNDYVRPMSSLVRAHIVFAHVPDFFSCLLFCGRNWANIIVPIKTKFSHCVTLMLLPFFVMLTIDSLHWRSQEQHSYQGHTWPWKGGQNLTRISQQSVPYAQWLAVHSVSPVATPNRIFAVCHVGLMLCPDWSVYKNTSLLWLSTNVTHVSGIRIFLTFFAYF